jgi:hypothetical protein
VGAEVSEDLATRARHEWWRPIAYAGLTVLLVEWACYHRAAIARLAAWVRNQGQHRGEPA